MNTPGPETSWRLGYRPALDGLRGAAVLLVVACHFGRGQLPMAGQIGVTIFFTLSGFLITTLLLQEYSDAGTISLRAFYSRRARRLLPALIMVVAVVLALSANGWPIRSPWWVYAGIATYSTNWLVLAHGTQWTPMTHTWTLAIEEQFYVVWPLVFIVVARWGRRAVLGMAAVGACTSVAWGLLSGRPAVATDVSAWSLLLGCVLAAFLHGRQTTCPRAALAIAVLGMLPLVHTSWSTAVYVLAPILTAITLYVAAQRRVPWLEHGWLRWAGVRSYGLYLWHSPIAVLCSFVPGERMLVTAGG